MVLDIRSRREEESVRQIFTMKNSTDDICIPQSDLSGFGFNRSRNNSEDKNRMAVPPADKTVEDSLSKGLMMLSINARNALEEEIHGVRCLGVTTETPDLLQNSLLDFNKEFLAIKNSPSRIAGIQKQKSGLHKRRSAKSDIPQTPPIDVLKNVIDTTNIDPTSPSTASRCYVNDPDIRLRFLRCESFDAKAAAKRFASFLGLCQEVFGDFVADRPIRLSDFFETPGLSGKAKRYKQHEKKCLSNSQVQYLPFRDRSGRRVKVGVGTANSELDLAIRIKINLILDWIASEDVETQQKGLVLVAWPSEPPTPASKGGAAAGGMSSGTSSCSSESEDEYSQWEGFLRPKYTKNDLSYHRRYYDSQPLRIAAMHWCSQEKPIYRILNSLFYFSLDSQSQSRYKVKFGEPVEIRYHLQAFGIPVDLIPLTHTMALKRQNHLQWMACRRYIEEQQQHQQKQHFQFQQQQYHQQQQFLQMQQHLHHSQQPWDDELALKFLETANGGSSSGKNQSQQPVLVECPRFYDVIIGKAKVCTNNPGNGFYSSLIEATHDEHDSLVHARDKVAMTWRILLHITEEQKGRFLDWNKSLNAWVVIQDKIVIRKKIANSYKEYKRSRYVTGRGCGSSSIGKKTKVPSDDNHYDSSNSDANGTDPNSAVVTTKRRKINGCLGNACGGIEVEKDKASMFAGL